MVSPFPKISTEKMVPTAVTVPAAVATPKLVPGGCGASETTTRPRTKSSRRRGDARRAVVTSDPAPRQAVAPGEIIRQVGDEPAAMRVSVVGESVAGPEGVMSEGSAIGAGMFSLTLTADG